MSTVAPPASETENPEPQAAPRPDCPLLDLPSELIIQIINCFDVWFKCDEDALHALACTCRLLQVLGEEQLYKSIRLRFTDDIGALIHSFEQRPDRLKAVQKLDILYKWHPGLHGTLGVRKRFNELIPDMLNLKEFHVESPYDNEKKWHESESAADWSGHDMVHFRLHLERTSLQEGSLFVPDIGLGKLEKFILHTHGDDQDFWNLNNFECLFRHPSIRYLHLSCVDLNCSHPACQDGNCHLISLKSFESRTPLETLILDECEIGPAPLAVILRTPKALRRLTLGENLYNSTDRALRPQLSAKPEETLLALAPVAHSLETLVHTDPTFKTTSDPDHPPPMKIRGDGMRQFHSLKYLECDPCSLFCRGILSDHTISPPSLETFCLRRPIRESDGGDFFERLPNIEPYTRLPSLKTLKLVQPLQGINLDWDERRSPGPIIEYVCNDDRVRERHARAFELHQARVEMKVYIEISAKESLIPPYLTGESSPASLCIYDSEKVGFCRVIDDRSDDEWDAEDISEAQEKHATLMGRRVPFSEEFLRYIDEMDIEPQDIRDGLVEIPVGFLEDFRRYIDEMIIRPEDFRDSLAENPVGALIFGQSVTEPSQQIEEHGMKVNGERLRNPPQEPEEGSERCQQSEKKEAPVPTLTDQLGKRDLFLLKVDVRHDIATHMLWLDEWSEQDFSDEDSFDEYDDNDNYPYEDLDGDMEYFDPDLEEHGGYGSDDMPTSSEYAAMGLGVGIDDD
ncbi:hypothetical protein BCR34DRAFT_209042 [Clohesyomyces aquaticus]|uniref:F-box domain-containing protein n=1 Tax=Clohesyomyces aquaticus TaxID=1231657 RepID=A0A1Y2A9N5_9PLEO|nr:hypothetical protein BCR34DRAFT_209042 [Clohesyomyces aquaticus]